MSSRRKRNDSGQAELFGGFGGGCGLEKFAQADQFVVRPRDDVHRHNFADGSSSRRSGFHRRFDRRNIAADEGRDITRTDFFPADEFNIGRLEHGVRRFKLSHKALGFDHS